MYQFMKQNQQELVSFHATVQFALEGFMWKMNVYNLTQQKVTEVTPK